MVNSNRVSQALIAFSWVALGVGFYITLPNLPSSTPIYLGLHIANALIISLAVMMFKLERIENRGLWMAIVLYVFANFIRFYWLAIDPSAIQPMLPYPTYAQMMGRINDYFATYWIISLGLWMLIVGAIFGQIASRDSISMEIGRWNNASCTGVKAPMALLMLATLLLVGLGYLSHRFSIGVMGAIAGEPLPLRLKGVIFYARTVATPLLILCAIVLASSDSNRRIVVYGLLLLVLHGVSDMILRGSRSGLLLSTMLILFWYMESGIEFSRIRTGLLVAMGVVAVSLIPMMTRFRSFRVAQRESIFTSMEGAFQGRESWIEEFGSGLKFVTFRIPGMESLWGIFAFDGNPLYRKAISIILTPDGIAGYLTLKIYQGISQEDNTLLAPGYLGWHYIVGGVPVICLGSLLLGAFTIYAWRKLGGRSFIFKQVIKIHFLWVLFVVMTEGTIDSIKGLIFIGMLTYGSMEIIFRMLRRGKVAKELLSKTGDGE